MEDSRFLELIKNITRYFDKEMNKKDESDFLKEIENHPAGQNAFLKEKSIRAKLKNNLYRPVHSENLAEQIKQQIKSASKNPN
ncbi:MAG: hypothetical protein IPM34_01445 [Saprospiraceae bacterium]|nr:hypothetical protein [Saprospiraceae bacterium]